MNRILKLRLILSVLFLFEAVTLAFCQPENQMYNDAYFNNSIDGNIYFPVKFVDGKFSQWNANEATGKLRFNLKSGIPEKLEDEKITNLSSVTTSFSLNINEKSTLNFQREFKPIGSNTESTFYLILFDGKMKFLAHLRVFETTSIDYTNPGKNFYTPVITYYFVNETGQISKLTSKKSILKIAEIDKAKTKDFMDKNAIKLSEWTEVQRVIDFNNGLLGK